MGTVLAVGGWVAFEDATAKEAWKKKAVASVKLAGWDGPLEGPGDSSPLDRHSIGKLWKEAADAPEPIEIAETETSLRFAAALASVTGRLVWAPAFFAAIRRAAGAAEGGAWAMCADEGGSVLSVDLGGRGSFRRLDEDEDVASALAEPEMVRACVLIGGDTPPPTLAELPPRQRAPRGGKAKRRTDGAGAGDKAAKKITAEPKAPPTAAKPAPRTKKITARAPGGLAGAVCLPGGDVVIIGLFGLFLRGNLDTQTWVSSSPGLGKQRWIATQRARLWLGTDQGLFVSEDEGASFVQRQPQGMGWSKPLFVEDAILVCEGGELARSDDDGVSFTRTFPRERGFGATGLARGTGAHAHRVVAVGIYGRIAVSDDHGRTWALVREGNDEAFNHVCIEGDDVFIVGATRILRAPLSSPGEVTDIGPPRKRDADFACIYASGDTLWVTAPVRLLRSRDRGASWEIIAQAQTVFRDVLVLGPRRLLVPTSESFAYLLEG